jgi:hypothetical protein
MSVIFYVWWTFLEEKLGGRKIEDGVLKFLIFSQEIPSDVSIHVGGGSFSLHKVQSNLNSCFSVSSIKQSYRINNSKKLITLCIYRKVSYYLTSLPFAICKLL